MINQTSTPSSSASWSDSTLARNIRTVRATLRNPLDGLPPEIFQQPIVERQLLHRTLVYVMDPTLIHEALVTHADCLDKGETVRRPLGPALGNGLLTAEGADWRWQRRAIAPVFRAAGLDRFRPTMVGAAERTRDRLLALPDRSIVSIGEEMMRATFDIIVDTMLSGAGTIDVDRTAATVTRYLHQTRWANLGNLLGLPSWMPHPGKRRAQQEAAELRAALIAAVNARRQNGEAPRQAKGDLVDVLIAAADPQDGRRMTDAEITDNLLTFLVAGHETTALGLAWTLDLLGRHPEIARRVQEEVLQAAPGRFDALPYTQQVFQEALRLYPAAPLVVRRVAIPFTLGSVELAVGTVLIVPVHAVHRHETLWDAPHVFDPDRFAPDAVAARPRLAYLPFGAGPRVCIGTGFAMLEATIILATLLRDLTFVSVQPTAPAPRMEITLRPSAPLLMRVEHRRIN